MWVLWGCFIHWFHRGLTSSAVRSVERIKNEEIAIVEQEVQQLHLILEKRYHPRSALQAEPTSQNSPDWLHQRMMAQLSSEMEQRLKLEQQCAGLLQELESCKAKQKSRFSRGMLS